MRIIDVWMQTGGTGPADHGAIFSTLARWTRSGDDVPKNDEHYAITQMDEGGVDIGLIAAWCGPQGFSITNEDVARCIEAYPERFRGLASVNLYRPMEAVRELRRWVRDYGFVGLRIVPWLWNLPPNDRRYYPLYAECIELGVPFCTQVGHTGPLCPSEPGRPIPYLDEVLLEFPELKVIGGHVGFPWIDEVISLATKYQNFSIDTSAYALHRLPPEFAEFMRGRGSPKVMFGTNFGMLTAKRCLEGLSDLNLSPDATEDFLCNNAARVFNL